MDQPTFPSAIRIIVGGAMGNWQWLLDLVVASLLAATLVRARRLDRALTALRQDRGALEALLGGFDGSTQQARSTIEKLRDLIDQSGRRVEHQTATAVALQDDLTALIGRGERLAERLDHAVRAERTGQVSVGSMVRGAQAERPRVSSAVGGEGQRVRSKAERDLLLALHGGR